ncbi:hypothetical protein B0H66DRAFT_638391 [Apodospora peruviana]|uniref:chitinase n=1 Tax=Apodospora peruviana TaxID=516989 RepID=A0AAE0M8I0_9PEZI|nr:hypothetical protein B0H66DRAFT_638391 [Apodospora peruviana]
MLRLLALATCLLGLLSAVFVQAQTCSPGNPCTIGCCSNDGGFCGLGPDFCATDKCNAALSLNGTCHQLAECDPGFNPGWGPAWGSTYVATTTCPLNVCCSKFGFCGTTEEFCGTSTVTQPSCSGSSATGRTVGYYEGWALSRSCDAMTPEQIAIGAYTHLIYGFLSIDPNTFAVIPEDPSELPLLSRFTALKRLKPGLQTWLSIGGWSFNDPGPTAATFSQLVGSTTAQTAFFSSLLSFMQQYSFDGVDIDWEYPTTPDRSGSPADYVNLATFIGKLRTQLNTKGYGLSMTLPSSYWYMRGFDIASLATHIDWFNVMTYDLHGTWDAIDPWIGNIMLAHTNLTEIRQTMDLMWRNNIPPAKINLGMGFYGRSFTASDPNCKRSGCPFSGGGLPGQCTQSEGTLSYSEIERIIKSSGASVILDTEAAVKIVTWNSNQWVSYDDADTFAMKMAYANSECLGGTMVWAVSLDMDGSAVAGLTGTSSGNLFPGSDGSTGNSGVVYFPPSIWSNPAASPVKCMPPCTIVLPPSPIQPTVVNWPHITTGITVSGGGTSTTTITVPPFTVSSVSFWPVTIASGAASSAVITAKQSVLPPSPVVISLPGSQTLVPTWSGTYTVSGMPVQTPSDAQPGTVAGCTAWYQTQSGDGCASIASMFGISVTDFTHWNPVVKNDCSNLWLGQDYCVGGPQGAVPTPNPIVGGNPSNCQQWYQAVSGDTCTSITGKFHLSNTDFYNLNQGSGINCANGILLGYHYCVSAQKTAGVGGIQTPVFGPSSHGVTIQPMATVSVTFGAGMSPKVTYTAGPPNGVATTTPFSPGASGTNGQEPPGCSGCGSTGCRLFGCGGHCGLFGCDGGCGLGFCGGGCGLGGCGPGCGPGACVNPGGGGGSLAPPVGGGGGDGDDNCAEPESAAHCTKTVFSPGTSTEIDCETVTGCSVTASTTTTTVNAVCTVGTDDLGLGPDFSTDDTNVDDPDAADITAVSAHVTVTVSFYPGGVAASVFGTTATFDLGHATSTINTGNGTINTSNGTAVTGTPSPSPNSCPLGFANPNDCVALIDADANLPPNNRLTRPSNCYSATSSDGKFWEWCEVTWQNTCQISIAWENPANPFSTNVWPLVSKFNAHVGDVWATAAGCFTGMKSYLDTDIGLPYYICIKRYGYNCWISP